MRGPVQKKESEESADEPERGAMEGEGQKEEAAEAPDVEEPDEGDVVDEADEDGAGSDKEGQESDSSSSEHPRINQIGRILGILRPPAASSTSTATSSGQDDPGTFTAIMKDGKVYNVSERKFVPPPPPKAD